MRTDAGQETGKSARNPPPTRTKTRISRRRVASSLACACGTRMFGEGTVLSVEALDDDTKLVVRFSSVGQKTLRAKFAKLEVV